MNQEEMEAIMNLTYPGLRLIHRDANLRGAEAKYQKGMLLCDERPVEGTLLGGGLLGTHRIALLSNRLEPVDDQEGGAKWRLGRIRGGAHYKVLDIYRRLGKTQVTLLHLPEKHWRFFEDVETNVDDLLVEYVRKHFDKCLEDEVLEVLTDAEWRKRSCHWVGMTDFGIPLPCL